MRRLVFFGKGGIGKTTVSTSLATLFRQAGLRVLLVGCDPKHDAYLKLAITTPMTTVMDQFLARSGRFSAEDLVSLVVDSPSGVHVIEAGGPRPGAGCAGRAVGVTIDLIRTSSHFAEKYDLVVFDVLGDVVCGGFAAPIRTADATDVVIVASHEYMALYAANNIAIGVSGLARQGGARVVGVVANKVGDDLDREAVESFARRIGTRCLGAVPLSDEVALAEAEGTSLFHGAMPSMVTRPYQQVLKALQEVCEADRIIPTPLSEEELRELVKTHLRSRRSRNEAASFSPMSNPLEGRVP